MICQNLVHVYKQLILELCFSWYNSSTLAFENFNSKIKLHDLKYKLVVWEYVQKRRKKFNSFLLAILSQLNGHSYHSIQLFTRNTLVIFHLTRIITSVNREWWLLNKLNDQNTSGIHPKQGLKYRTQIRIGWSFIVSK